MLECKPQRVSSDCAIFANTRSSVVEFGKGEEWLILVGGISASYRKFSYARRNEQKSTQLTQRAGMSKNPHGGRRTGGFHTVTFSPRRNEQKSTRVGHRAGTSRNSHGKGISVDPRVTPTAQSTTVNVNPRGAPTARRNEQKST